MTQSYGIIRANFIWEDGKINKVEKDKNQDKVFKLLLKNMLTKANF